MITTKNIAQVEKKIGYQFKRPELLIQALTHRSFSAQHNERFEFLGDALLEAIISTWLFINRKKSEEGDLTRLRANLVKGTQLANIAKTLDLGQFIRLGSGELKSGGARRESILSNIIEAIIAAIYLDSDYLTCEHTTLKLFHASLSELPDAQALKDPKTQLQELLQAKGLTVPSYTIVEEHGPKHAREFHISAATAEHEVQASGTSRKKAEQKAAEILLTLYQPKK